MKREQILMTIVVVAILCLGCQPHVHLHLGGGDPELAAWRQEITEQVNGITTVVGHHLEAHRAAEGGVH